MSLLLRDDLLAGLATLLLIAGCVLSALDLLAPGRRGRTGRRCIGIGGYLLLLALLARGTRVGGFPFTQTYDVVLLSAAGLALLFALGIPARLNGIGGLAAGLTTAMLVGLTLLLTPQGTRLPLPAPAAIEGLWFPLHVLSSGLGYGGLLLASAAGLLGLLAGPGPAGSASDRSLRADLESLAWRGLSWGYPWLTLGITLGGVWGWLTWGHYWAGSTKEVLTLLTWTTFTLAFHTRRLHRWRARRHALILAAGGLLLLVSLLAAESLAVRLGWTTGYVF